MKIVIAVFVVLFTMGAGAAQECIFGEVSSSYAYQMDADGEPIFSLNEKIGLNDERLLGLNKTDKAAILHYFVDGGSNDITTEEQALEEMLDGYIAYYSTSYEYNFASFVQVAYYPGDNEYGAIYQIDSEKNTFERVAVITDGDIEDCKVFKK